MDVFFCVGSQPTKGAFYIVNLSRKRVFGSTVFFHTGQSIVNRDSHISSFCSSTNVKIVLCPVKTTVVTPTTAMNENQSRKRSFTARRTDKIERKFQITGLAIGDFIFSDESSLSSIAYLRYDGNNQKDAENKKR